MTVSMHLHDCRTRDGLRAEIEEATQRFLAARDVTEAPPTARNRNAHTSLVLPGSIDHQNGRKSRGKKK